MFLIYSWNLKDRKFVSLTFFWTNKYLVQNELCCFQAINEKTLKQQFWKGYRSTCPHTNSAIPNGELSPSKATAVLAECLKWAFASFWRDVTPTEIPDIHDVAHMLENCFPPLPSVVLVKGILENLHPKKGTCVDQIPALVPKKSWEELAPIVHDIICSSISQCKYSGLYKHVLISPIPEVAIKVLWKWLSPDLSISSSG